jgi:hypothetical protein
MSENLFFKSATQKPEGQRPLGKPFCKWKIILKLIVKLLECVLNSTGSG